MRKYIIRRFLSITPVLWLVSVIVFALIHLVPGDPVLVILGSSAEAEQIELMRHRLGLDQNIAVQYLKWSTALLKGDLGTSIMSDEPVAEQESMALTTRLDKISRRKNGKNRDYRFRIDRPRLDDGVRTRRA